MKALNGNPNSIVEALDIILEAKLDELNKKLTKVQIINHGVLNGKEKERETTLGKTETCQ